MLWLDVFKQFASFLLSLFVVSPLCSPSLSLDRQIRMPGRMGTGMKSVDHFGLMTYSCDQCCTTQLDRPVDLGTEDADTPTSTAHGKREEEHASERSADRRSKSNRGVPLPLGRGFCETKSKKGRSRHRKPLRA